MYLQWQVIRLIGKHKHSLLTPYVINTNCYKKEDNKGNSCASTNGGVMVVQEAVTDELQRDRGLADAAVAQHHDFVDAEAARRARSLARHAAACRRLRPRVSPAPALTRPPPSPTAHH